VPRDEPGKVDDEIAQASRRGECQRRRRIEPQRGAEDHECALLDADGAGNDERRAADRLDQRLDGDDIVERARMAEENQREPELSGGEQPCGKLPCEADADVGVTLVHGPQRAIEPQPPVDRSAEAAGKAAIDERGDAGHRARALEIHEAAGEGDHGADARQ
jgi:hypothetical protein